MEDPRWLRLITIGLVLAALAVGYFLFTGRFSSNTAVKKGSEVGTSVPVASSSPTPAPSVLGQNTQKIYGSTSTPTPTPTPAPASAYNKIVSRTQNRTQNGTQTLPRTGFPVGLAAVFSVSVIISGWGLRKYPK